MKTQDIKRCLKIAIIRADYKNNYHKDKKENFIMMKRPLTALHFYAPKIISSKYKTKFKFLK